MTLRYGLLSVFMFPLAINQVQAGAVTWQTPVNDTGLTSDILTSGSYFDSATTGSTVTVGGVTFNGASGFSGGTISFGSSNIHLSNVDRAYGTVHPAPSGWNANYLSLVAGGAYKFTTPIVMNLTLAGLTIGQSYTMQIFEPFWDVNWATKYSDGVHSSANVNLTGPTAGAGASSVPQYVRGSFTADATSETIFVSTVTANAIFGAIQVRSDGPANVPEPSGLLLMGLASLGVWRRLRLA